MTHQQFISSLSFNELRVAQSRSPKEFTYSLTHSLTFRTWTMSERAGGTKQ
uniref:Uncharacterized protein n=1 Tax=Physcomitrium patens TaxID=3218 RepID=A0A2K1JR37_PHYPA|nr:hypothetical protein PHYPA_016289 [Physcomitrium patens]